MLVTAKPLLSFADLVASSVVHYRVPPWDRAMYFRLGRDALIYALRTLEIKRGETVVLPAYICASVPAVLAAHGYYPRFVDVETTLELTHEKLRNIQLNGGARVFLLVDYFGFLSAENTMLAAELRRDGGVVIEDRCHSALSGQIGCEAYNAVIFSFRKTVPCRDGGAVLFSGNVTKHGGSSACDRLVSDSLFLVKTLVENAAIRFGWPNIYSPSIARLRKVFSGSDLTTSAIVPIRENGAVLPSALLSKNLADSERLKNIASVRRRNYLNLLERLRPLGIEPLFKSLTDEVVPQVLPVKDTSGGLAKYLRTRGIGAYAWPGRELPVAVASHPRDFPNACQLNRVLVCLPVHQSIKERHIDRVAYVAKSWIDRRK